MPKINAKYELPTLPCKLFEARLSPKFTVAYINVFNTTVVHSLYIYNHIFMLGHWSLFTTQN